MELNDSDSSSSSGDDIYDFAARYRKLAQQSKKKNLVAAKQQSEQIDPEIDPIIVPIIDPIDSIVDWIDCAKSCEIIDECIPSTSKTPEGQMQTGSNKNCEIIDECIPSTSKTPEGQMQTGSNKKRKRNYNTDSANVLGPVICIGDFCDGYDMPPPKEPKKIKTIEDELDEIDDMMAKKNSEKEDEEALLLANLTREMSVKVYWQERKTYRFNIRKLQTIESIYDFFAKLEDIKDSEVSLTLNKKLLAPTDTPYAMNYKITDFIDGDIVFYRSRYEKTDITRIEKPEDEVDFKIMQKNVKHPLCMGLQKEDKMIVLYVKISEKLGLDLSSFTLEFDGDIIEKLATMESLDLEGGECFELHQKQV